jgi:hypothetical protein
MKVDQIITRDFFNTRDIVGFYGKQEFRRTDFGSRLLMAEGEGGEDRCG